MLAGVVPVTVDGILIDMDTLIDMLIDMDCVDQVLFVSMHLFDTQHSNVGTYHFILDHRWCYIFFGILQTPVSFERGRSFL